MGHRNSKVTSRIPALSEAVKNLLAIHSLEAWPSKSEWFVRGARLWTWRVIKTGEDPHTARTVFAVGGSQPLEVWVRKVQIHVNAGKLGMNVYLDLETTVP